MSDRKLVIISEHLSEEAEAWIAERCAVVHCGYDDPDFEQRLTEAEGLVIRTYTTLDRTSLEKATKLKVIGRAGTGLDNIDLGACRDLGIEVVYRPEANTQAVVEYVFFLLGDALRPRTILTQPVDASAWSQIRAETVAPHQLSELTMGILGMGRVGSGVARVAAAFGMKVLFSDLREVPDAERYGAESVPVGDLFALSDVVSLHVDGRESNRKFVRESLLEHMKSNAMLINTSRGFVVDNESLADKLGKNPEMLALLDVHEPEPFGADYPLLGLANVRLYPHLASRTKRAMDEMSWVVRDVVAVLEGEHPKYLAP